MGARWYDPYINRFLSPDSIIPQPGNPQSFNRYSYVNNRPLVAIDPTGHDLVIVGGIGGDVNRYAMDHYWKEWIMAYKGWDQATWKEVIDAWEAAVGTGGLAAGNTELAKHGIHLFTWGGTTIEEAEANAKSAITDDAAMLKRLSDEMTGHQHQDITLIGWSKGGNLVMHYLKQVAEGESLTKPMHVVLLSPANTVPGEFVPRGISGYGKNEIPYIAGTNVANVCPKGDYACDTSVQGAINFNTGISGHVPPHGHKAQHVLTALNVANDHNAWTEPYIHAWQR